MNISSQIAYVIQQTREVLKLQTDFFFTVFKWLERIVISNERNTMREQTLPLSTVNAFLE